MPEISKWCVAFGKNQLINYSFQIGSIDTDGGNQRTLLTEKSHTVSLPKALAVHNKMLYVMDPRYDKLERIDLDTGKNVQTIMDNEPDLKTFTIFKKRPSL